MPEAYCPLCGVVLQSYDGLEPPENGLPWLAEVRAVRSVRGTSSPFVTGIGYLGPSFELIAHPDESTRYLDVTERLEIMPTRFISREYWVFPFHDVCWSLLLYQTASREQDSAQVARLLFEILYRTPWNRYYTAECGHDYGGASKFHLDLENPRYIVPVPSDLSVLTADPREHLQANFLEGNMPEYTNVTTTFNNRTSSTDVFCALPDEIMVFILSSLSSSDVCRLRYSSKRVAIISSFRNLPQSFWASRFGKEHEMGFAFACPSSSEIEKHIDWRKLYIAFRNSLQSPNQGLGIKNRRRIWQSLKNLSKPLNNLMNNRIPQQDENSDKFQQWGCHDRSPVVSAEILPENQATDVLKIGSRRIGVGILPWPQPEDLGFVNIGVSFCWFNGRSYVSGLRAWEMENTEGTNEPRQIGLVVPSTETAFCFDPRLLDGVEVALTVSGITGLRFLTRSALGERTYTVGDFATTTPDIGVARLSRQCGSQITAFQIGFDMCKLVSFQLIDTHSEKIVHNTASSSIDPCSCEVHNTKQLTNVAKIWSPGILEHVDIQSFPATVRSQMFSLHLNMDFAGPGARRLSSLQRIVALVGDITGLFLGFKFVYNDGESKIFCNERNMREHSHYNIKCAESSFYIDSAAGERISALKVGCTSSSTGIKCIELYTSMGNHTCFGLHHRSNPEDPIGGFSILKPPHGTFISGFVATLGVSDRAFKAFGIQSQPHQHPLPPPLPTPQEFPTEQTLPSEAFSILGARHFIKTMASLSNVRRVRVSSGICGSSRSAEHVSGLWLEYHDTDRPSIVGQWLDESGAFELTAGEQLTQISIWTSNEFTATYLGSAKLGKVIVLQFDTSKGRSVRFGRDGTEGAVHFRFAMNAFEKLDTICWCFNTRWDRATVTYSPHSDQAHYALHLLRFDVGHWGHWIIPEKLLCSARDTDGNLSSVVAIQISFIPEAITGLTFTYSSGHMSTLGSTEGESSTWRLENGEEFLRLDATFAEINAIHSVVMVSFHTNHKRTMTIRSQAYYEKKVRAPRILIPLDNPPPPPPPMPREPHYVFSLHPSMDVRQAACRYQAFDFPADAERFVGVWGLIGRRRRRLCKLNPIFSVAR